MDAVYHYTARSDEGSIVTGTMRAPSRYDAVLQLRGRRLFVTSLDDEADVRGKVKALLTLAAPRRRTRAAFFRSLAVLVGAGATLRRALAVSIDQCGDSRFAEALRAAAADVDEGTALSDAMSRRPAEFSTTIVAMVRAGEVGGVLEEVLDRCAIMLEREGELRRRVAAALTYPGLVMAAAGGLVGFLLLTTVPSLSSIFTELHASLPLSTRLMIAVSESLRTPVAPFAGAAICACIIGGTVAFQQGGARSLWLDERMLKLPVIGRIRSSAATATFALTVGTLLQCGVAIAESVGTAAGVVGNGAYRQAILRVERLLAEGTGFALALRTVGTFEALCVGLAAIGEESGSLDGMLLRAAEHYEADVSATLATITSIIEPIMIAVLGIAVGTIVASIIIPLYAAIGNIR